MHNVSIIKWLTFHNKPQHNNYKINQGGMICYTCTKFESILTNYKGEVFWPFFPLDLFIPLHLETTSKRHKLDLLNNLLCTSNHMNKWYNWVHFNTVPGNISCMYNHLWYNIHAHHVSTYITLYMYLCTPNTNKCNYIPDEWQLPLE